MKFHALPTIVTVAMHVAGVASWGIDKDSCKGKAFDFMHESVNSAFSFVDSAIAALAKTPLDDMTKNLLSWMFEPGGDDAALKYAIGKLGCM
ncbi:hypothetical protein BCR34DRAFT_231430 [Clohesyomyces aquaticus]|uniref:Uncharacterized protein n=1 Tax=Clohesyomyces aquaticus TaxID=1231657 RepID=A0A1Y1ZVV0_9PLEO|nr:hypothetical protein BCR34DRAFT_231430 [Clohesyomyces aquaticus]